MISTSKCNFFESSYLKLYRMYVSYSINISIDKSKEFTSTDFADLTQKKNTQVSELQRCAFITFPQ